MFENVSHASCLKIFPCKCVCTFDFDPVFPFSLVMRHGLLCLLLFRLETEADIGIAAFHKTFKGFPYFHILKMRIFFVVQDF